MLKRLADAERDGDRIYAVIKGVGASSDGRDRGLTAPRPEGQLRALRRAYAQAGVSPADRRARRGARHRHRRRRPRRGRGALDACSPRPGAARQACALGSVKSMIGHTKATAGVAGLIKAALALHHRVLPPTIGVDDARTRGPTSPAAPFYVNTEPRPWVHGATDHPRRAGVSAFGFGGTNFHAVLEEYTGEYLANREPTLDPGRRSCSSGAASRRRGSSMRVERPGRPSSRCGAEPAPADLAYTPRRREAGRRRRASATLAIVADSLADLAKKLRRRARR